MTDKMAAVKDYNWQYLSRLLIYRLRFFHRIVSHYSAHQLWMFDINLTKSKMADKMAAVQGYISSVYISFSVIAYRISPYANFYAGPSCYNKCITIKCQTLKMKVKVVVNPYPLFTLCSLILTCFPTSIPLSFESLFLDGLLDMVFM